MKRSGGRRYYRPEDVELLSAIRHLLYGEGYTIKGVQRILKLQGAKAIIDLVARLQDEQAPASVAALASVPNSDAADASAAASAQSSAQAGRLTPDQRGQLEAVLEELSNCNRLLEAASAR